MTSSALVLDREQTVSLIRLYAAHRHLWDVGDARYFHRGQRERAWRAIAAALDKPMPELKKKLESLMGSYRREKSREKQSLSAGLAPDEAYKSKWYGYEHFHFLTEKTNPSGVPQGTGAGAAAALGAFDPVDDDAIKEELEEYEGTDEGEGYDDEGGGDRGCGHGGGAEEGGSDELAEQEVKFGTEPAPESPQRRAKRRRRRRPVGPAPPAAAHDPHRAFGEYVASELRKYDAATLAHVKHAISGVIFAADIGRLPAPPALPPTEPDKTLENPIGDHYVSI